MVPTAPAARRPAVFRYVPARIVASPAHTAPSGRTAAYVITGPIAPPPSLVARRADVVPARATTRGLTAIAVAVPAAIIVTPVEPLGPTTAARSAAVVVTTEPARPPGGPPVLEAQAGLVVRRFLSAPAAPNTAAPIGFAASAAVVASAVRPATGAVVMPLETASAERSAVVGTKRGPS